MRGTNSITNSNSLYYMSRNFENLSTVANQLAAKQQVVNLEDNPLSAVIGVRMLNVISRAEQYNTNIKTGIGSLNLIDGFLASAKKITDDINKLTVGSASATTTPQMRSANAIELNNLLKSLIGTANAKDGERYVFGGQQSTTPPFTIVNGRYVNYTGNDKKITINVDGNNTTIPINCTGNDVFGNMTTKIPSRDMNPNVNLSTDNSTKLSDLNGGQGVPKGKIKVYYSSYPEGLEVDLSGCDTLEDVKDMIEQTTLNASRNLNPTNNAWLDGKSMNWHDLQDRYVKVTLNPDHTGISLEEIDLGEALPEPTAYEKRMNLSYTGVNPATGNPWQAGEIMTSAGPDYDKLDYVYSSGAKFNPTLRVDNVAQNKVADALGIKGSAKAYDPLFPDPVLDGFLNGAALKPRVTNGTLLADLENYNDGVYTFTNGSKPNNISVRETTQDTGNVFSNWKLSGLTKGVNTGPDGDFYARAVNVGTAAKPEIRVEIYSCPVDKATAADLVATGSYSQGQAGGTVVLKEANNSGLSGTVGIVLPPTVTEAKVSLEADFGSSLQGSVHVPAFVPEKNPDGSPKDVFNLASGWNIRGLDKPPAKGYDINHPASTDLDGDVSANFRYDPATNSLMVELSRPAFGNQPATVIANASLYLGDPPNTPPNLGNAVSGRVEFIGAPGFEGISGSVFLQVPAGACFSAAGTVIGNGPGNATSITYPLMTGAAAGTIVLGGAMELKANQTTIGPFTLTGDTLFKKGQTFDSDVFLPGGGVIKAGVALDRDTLIPKGVQVEASTILGGTILPAGARVTFDGVGPVAGTVIPRGSYYDGGPGFPADGMGMTAPKTDGITGNVTTLGSLSSPAGYDVRATFATVEDFNRAVEQAGVYVSSQISADGKKLEFSSSLAGAWLTVSEDTDCYEQMGDVNQQLTELNLNGLIKGVNADKNGNSYTEVIYYPPNKPPNDKDKVKLISDSGEIVEVDPGYYVRVYSSKEEMEKSYENRDNTKMVAEGFIPAGRWNPAWDPALYDPTDPTTNPFLPGNPPAVLGVMDDLVLEERNGSGVHGNVNLNYYGKREQLEVKVAPNGQQEIDFDPWVNDDITVFPGGLRPEGSPHTTIQEWDIFNIVPGVTCDYSGTFHGQITGDPTSPAGASISLYKDASRTVMTAKSDPAEAPTNGKITLYEVDARGNFALDAKGDRIVAGSMDLARNDLPDGVSDTFTLSTGALRNYGQEREENIFSTINDILDALNQNDEDKLHDLIGQIEKDVKRVTGSQGEVGARVNRLKLLSERHADDIIKFDETLVSRVGMDDQALAMALLNYQAATNAYQAAMQVSMPMMQMSLLQYL